MFCKGVPKPMICFVPSQFSNKLDFSCGGKEKNKIIDYFRQLLSSFQKVSITFPSALHPYLIISPVSLDLIYTYRPNSILHYTGALWPKYMIKCKARRHNVLSKTVLCKSHALLRLCKLLLYPSINISHFSDPHTVCAV